MVTNFTLVFTWIHYYFSLINYNQLLQYVMKLSVRLNVTVIFLLSQMKLGLKNDVFLTNTK